MGRDPRDVARAVLEAVRRRSKDVVLAGPLPALAVFFRNLWPALFFKIMALRARKEQKAWRRQPRRRRPQDGRNANASEVHYSERQTAQAKLKRIDWDCHVWCDDQICSNVCTYVCLIFLSITTVCSVNWCHGASIMWPVISAISSWSCQLKLNIWHKASWSLPCRSLFTHIGK